MNKNWRCPSGRTFFGLTDNYMESVYEQFFALKHHGGWSLTEAYNLPVQLRNWFYNTLLKTKEEEKKRIEEAQKR